MCPTGVGQAHYAFSDDDGKTWHAGSGQVYSYDVEVDQGPGKPTSHKLYARVERPQLAFDKNKGGPTFLFNGVSLQSFAFSLSLSLSLSLVVPEAL